MQQAEEETIISSEGQNNRNWGIIKAAMKSDELIVIKPAAGAAGVNAALPDCTHRITEWLG